MTEITNNKELALGPPPSWAPFKGFSVLFDNPGVSLSSAGGTGLPGPVRRSSCLPG